MSAIAASQSGVKSGFSPRSAFRSARACCARRAAPMLRASPIKRAQPLCLAAAGRQHPRPGASAARPRPRREPAPRPEGCGLPMRMSVELGGIENADGVGRHVSRRFDARLEFASHRTETSLPSLRRRPLPRFAFFVAQRPVRQGFFLLTVTLWHYNPAGQARGGGPAAVGFPPLFGAEARPRERWRTAGETDE